MLLDQFGYPIRPTIKDANPGYKRVSQGHGEKTYEEYDPFTGIKRVITIHEDGKITQKRFQNVEAIVDVNKAYREDYKPHSKAPFVRQTAIPAIHFWDMMEKCGWQPGKNGGEYDKKKFDQIINDGDYRAFKTVPGRVSCRKQMWI